MPYLVRECLLGCGKHDEAIRIRQPGNLPDSEPGLRSNRSVSSVLDLNFNDRHLIAHGIPHATDKRFSIRRPRWPAVVASEIIRQLTRRDCLFT